MTQQSSCSTYLDLRGTPCPLNFVRCRLALETLALNDSLKIDLDPGEPETTVIAGLREVGHDVVILKKEPEVITLMVTCSG